MTSPLSYIEIIKIKNFNVNIKDFSDFQLIISLFRGVADVIKFYEKGADQLNYGHQTDKNRQNDT